MKKLAQFVLSIPVLPTVLGLTLVLSHAPPASAQDVWTGSDAAHSVNWTDPTNWLAGTAPLAYDSLTFSASTVANSNGFPNGTAFDGITFNSGSAFNLKGNSILLSGQILGTNNGVVNIDGSPAQAVGLNLSLDWGYYTFAGTVANGLGLNGTLSLNTGGVAYFDGNVSTTSLSNDSSGLIAGLGGAGLIYTSGTFPIPSSLATVSGGAIVPYTATTQVASGNIPSSPTNNLELTANGSSTTYSNNVGVGTIFANTITVDQSGNSGGTSPTILTNATGATLVLGNVNAGTGPYVGGIYVLNSAAGTKQDFLLNGGNLTAGPMTGSPTNATIVFAVNGTTSGNQMEMNSSIQNNGSGGAVAVVKTGTGSTYFADASTYTGGTYVLEGQLQASGSTSAFGTGPVYVAGGATAYLVAAGTYANSFYLSPGLGDPSTVSGAIANPGSLTWGANVTLSGQINLLGAPAPTGHGDRIAGNDTGGAATITGQITGTGTLEFGGAHTGSYTMSNTNTNSPNNWQGGINFYATTGVAVNVALKMGANNQLPSGPSAGNINLIPPGASTGVYTSLNLNGFNATINGLTSPVLGVQAYTLQAMISDGDPLSASTGNSTLTLGANNTTATFNGISTNRGGGLLSLVKIGTGTQTFTGPLAHGGSTTISNGSFQLENIMTNTPLITVAPGATFDASQGPNGGFTVSPNQTLTGTGTVLGSTSVNGTITSIMAVSGAGTNIGTLTNNGEGGTVTLNGGATNIWYVINAGGTAGSAAGSSLVLITNGNLSINNASVVTPIYIKIVSLATNGTPGNATFNPNVNQSWTLVQTPSAISGFTGSSQFAIDTSAFGNLPAGTPQFSVTTNAAGNNLVLKFSAAAVITNALVNQTNNAGTTAIFTVGAAGPTPITYQWVQGGTTVLTSGSVSASGGAVTITTNGAGTTSTLTIANVQDPDGGAISVNVTNNAGIGGSSTASLTIIDAPTSPSIQQSGAPVLNAGAVSYLTVSTVTGTAPFTYIWSFNGNVISGATSSTFGVELSASTAGNYSVIVSNAAGSVTNAPVAIGPVTVVPNQLIYEPFTSYAPMSSANAPYTWQGVTNLYNQLTGEGAYWFHSSGSHTDLTIQAPNSLTGFNQNNSPGYPWPGLAGDSDQCMYMPESSGSDNDHLQFWDNGPSAGQSVYFSFILSCAGFTPGNAGASDCIAAFSDDTGTTFNLKLSTEIQSDGSYWLGLSKGVNQVVDANTEWATNFQEYQDILVVGLYQVNSGLSTSNDDTVSMWFNPTNTSFGTTNIPTPTLGPSNFGTANTSIHSFAVHATAAPGARYFSDLRIGTTWASVLPMSAPNLTLANEVVVPGGSVTFTSENAGNPVTTYQWFFGTNHTALSDGPNPTGDGSIITNSSTGALTIIGAKVAELGTYKVIGSNTDPVTSATLTGSASATLSFAAPPLSVAYHTPNVVMAWPTNWYAAGFILQQSTNLSVAASWQTVATNSYVVSGTNETYSASQTGASEFFRVKGP